MKRFGDHDQEIPFNLRPPKLIRQVAYSKPELTDEQSNKMKEDLIQLQEELKLSKQESFHFKNESIKLRKELTNSLDSAQSGMLDIINQTRSQHEQMESKYQELTQLQEEEILTLKQENDLLRKRLDDTDIKLTEMETQKNELHTQPVKEDVYNRLFKNSNKTKKKSNAD